MKPANGGTAKGMNDLALSGDRLALRLPVQDDSVRIGRRAAAQFAEEAGCDATTLWRVRLAASEALSNVVLHAHAPEAGDRHYLVLLAESSGASTSRSPTRERGCARAPTRRAWG